MILCYPVGNLTFFSANYLILSQTTSMPRSSDAFNSRVAALKLSPKISWAKAIIDVVFPHPGGPVRIKFGTFYS